MTNKEHIISDLSLIHLDDIFKIWVESLPYNIKSIMGKKIITSYLKNIFLSKDFLKKGIFKSEKLIGFVIFGNDKSIINRVIFENLFHIFFSFLKNIVTFKFKKIICFFDIVIYLTACFFKREKNINSSELLIIAVKKEYQKENLGSKLISESLSDPYFKKLDYVNVVTLKSTPENIFFYEKNNFKKTNEVYGRIYLKLFLTK